MTLTISPNPSRHTTSIRYTIHDPGYTIQNPSLSIYDATGRLVKSFLLSTTYYLLPTAVSWHADDNTGRKVGSGVYILEFKSEGQSLFEKLVLIE